LVPRSLAIPLLQVSKELQITDHHVFRHSTYNWHPRGLWPPDGFSSTINSFQPQTSFRGTSEEEFYLPSKPIKFGGGEALELMRVDEAFTEDSNASLEMQNIFNMSYGSFEKHQGTH
jgi:hypothetical protein